MYKNYTYITESGTQSLEIALNFSKKEMIGLQDRACKRIISEFSIKKMSTSYNNIYNEIIQYVWPSRNSKY